jgi:hypothetical protein
LYDKVYRDDILRAAWQKVRANRGSALRRPHPLESLGPLRDKE